jgi:hypothetical protein
VNDLRRPRGPDGPNFFLLGAHKSGTTALFREIVSHPEVFAPPEKETFFFVDEQRWSRGTDWYERTWFRGAAAYIARGEGTPRYLYTGKVCAPRVARYLDAGRAAFVAVLRDPIDRAWSHFRYECARAGVEATDDDFLRAVEDELAVGADGGSDGMYEGRMPGYVWRGRYAEHLAEWEGTLGETRLESGAVLAVTYDDFRAHHDRTLQRVFAHLGVSTSVRIPSVGSVNAGGVPRSSMLMRLLDGRRGVGLLLKRVLPMPHTVRRSLARHVREMNTRPVTDPSRPPEAARRLLAECFATDLERLEHRLERPLGAWRRSR